MSDLNAAPADASSAGRTAVLPGQEIEVSRGLAMFWIVTGLAGWVVSFLLFLEYVGQLRNQTPIINCTFSVLVSCTPNLLSPGGNLLGFTNAIIGITLFVGPIYAGVATLAGGRMRPWYWRVYLSFVSAAFLLVHVFAYRSIFEYGVLCPWCMVVWLVTIPLFWGTFGWAVRSGVFGDSGRLSQVGGVISSWAWVIVVVDYLAIGLAAELQLQVIESFFI